MRKILTATLTIGLVLSLTGCSVSTTTTILAGVEAAVEVAAGLTLNPAEQAYVAGALTFVSQAAKELSSADSDSLKFETISGYFASDALAQLPAGSPLALNAVLLSIKAFLSVINPGGVSAAQVASVGGRASVHPQGKSPSMVERHALKSISDKAIAARSRMK